MEKVRICVMTATRAEFGLLKNVLEKLVEVPEFDIRIVATGMHLSPAFGYTYREIEEAGFVIDRKIEMQMGSDSTVSVAKTMGLSMIGFSDYFQETKPDYLLVAGDRYEALAVAATALVMRIPILHLFGGETTEGAVDEAIRHSITKMSYLHFVTTPEHGKRVVQLGEDPRRVFVVGGTGSENVRTQKFIERGELSQILGFDLSGDYVVATLHSVTLEDSTAEGQVREFLSACNAHPELKFVFTKANSDADGRIINDALESFCQTHKNAKLFDSLGSIRYLSAVKYCAFVLGNSSSGIMEVPSLGVPTVNIGDRERGRARAESVIDCAPDCDSILKAIERAMDPSFRSFCKSVKNPYAIEGTSEKIVEILRDRILGTTPDLKKSFFDLDFCGEER